jgi:DNA invertase Pin-like site-specific DNA recombinase
MKIQAFQAQSPIITKLDRGFSSASDCLVNVEALEKVGMSLHILNLGGQTIDTATPTGNFFITVMAGAAELERNLIRERCQEGRVKRQKEGSRTDGIPYGRDYDKATNTLVFNNQEKQTIQRIFQLRREGMT